MNLVLTLLRLIHIIFAFMWFGLGATMTLYIVPALAGAGESGLRYMNSLYTNTRLSTAFAATAGITVLAGILLYFTGDASTSFSQTGNIVLGIGALVGLIAAIHGGAVLGRSSRVLAATLTKYADSQPIAAEGLTALREQIAQVTSHSRIGFVLTLIALIAMGSARYL